MKIDDSAKETVRIILTEKLKQLKESSPHRFPHIDNIERGVGMILQKQEIERYLRFMDTHL